MKRRISMRQTQSKSQSSWSHYTKAAAAFMLTTATYLIARTTGWLPGWFSLEQSPEETGSTSALTLLAKKGIGDFAFQASSQRKLLQQQSLVINPIPDQIIEAEEQYQYQLSENFQGNYTFLEVVETGNRNLPNWLSFNYQLVGSYSGMGESIAINDNIVFVSGPSGLNILNISNPADPVLISQYNASNLGLIVFQNDIIFGMTWNYLLIINVSIPMNPSLITAYNLTGFYSAAMDIQKNMLCTVGNYGLHIINVTNPESPALIGSFAPDSSGEYVNIAVKNGIAYVAMANTGAGIHLINISNPVRPSLISTIATFEAFGVTVVGNTVYVADSTSGLKIIDVTYPAGPQLLGSCISPVDAQNVAVAGNVAIVADGSYGLQMIDITDSSNPVLVGSYSSGYFTSQLIVRDNLVFMVSYGSSPSIVDLTQGQLSGSPPLSLTGKIVPITLFAYVGQDLLAKNRFNLVVDQLPYQINSIVSDRSIFPGETKALTFSSQNLFKASDQEFLGLSIKLMNGQHSPDFLTLLLQSVLLGSYTLNTIVGVSSITVQDNILYLVEWAAYPNLQIWNVSNPKNSFLLSLTQYTSLAISGLQSIYWQNNFLYIAGIYAGLQIVDVSNPSLPKLISSITTGYAYDVAVQGKTAYIADWDAGLVLIDVSNATFPVKKGNYTLNTQPYAISVSANIVYIISNAGLAIFNVSNVTNIKKLSEFSASPQNLFLLPEVAFLNEGGALTIINITNLSHPLKIGSYRPKNMFGSQSAGVIIQSNVAFVTNGEQGVTMIDVTDLLNPFQIGSYTTLPNVNNHPNSAVDVAVVGNVVYLACADTGFLTIDVSHWQITLSPGVEDVGNYPLRLTATDSLGGSSHIDFMVRVEGPPKLNGTILLQRAWVGQLFNYFAPSNLFVDPNDDVISYSSDLADGKSLPSWLKFNPVTISFGGVPQSNDAGNVTIILFATDHICSEIPAVNFTISVGFLPVLSRRIPNQLAPIGSLYQFSVPKNSFYDLAGLPLSYLAQGVNNQPLPDWLEFNSTSLIFFGVANTSNITIYTLQLIASNSAGGQVIASFTLRTDHFPVFNKIFSLPKATVNQPWVWTLPRDAFVDEDGDTLTYSVTQEDDSVLPSWLSFNPITRTLAGVPLLSGFQGLKIKAQDSYGGSNSTYFNMTILPELPSGLVVTSSSARVGKKFEFQVLQNSFGSNGTLSYSVALTDGEALPSWLRFIASNLSFSGMPGSLDVGSYDITVTATDSQDIHYNVSFTLNVNPNYPPQVRLPISNQIAHVNEPFVFYAGQQTFVDLNGDNLTYTINTLPSWLSFDPAQLKFSGTPSRSDTDPLSARVVNVELTAHDDESQTSTLFTISVQGTSNLMLFLQVGIPLLSGLASLYEAYRKRALVLNRCCKNRIVKREAVATTSEEFHVDLATQPEQVGNIQVKLPKPEETKSTASCCMRLFRQCKESPDHLPPVYPLPTWLKYSDNNRLFSSRVLPMNHPQFTVQILNSAGVIREEVDITVHTAKV
jgi:hypothetical protein